MRVALVVGSIAASNPGASRWRRMTTRVAVAGGAGPASKPGTLAGRRQGTMRVAVVGGGIAGMAAAWALQDFADVTLFEARPRLGGHTDTHNLLVNGRACAVDLGLHRLQPHALPVVLGVARRAGGGLAAHRHVFLGAPRGGRRRPPSSTAPRVSARCSATAAT